VVDSGGGATADQAAPEAPTRPVVPPADPGTEPPPALPDITPAPDPAPPDRFWVEAESNGAFDTGGTGAAALIPQAPDAAGRALNPAAVSAGLAVLLAWVAEPQEPCEHRQRPRGR
jgi:hypothetical protein